MKYGNLFRYTGESDGYCTPRTLYNVTYGVYTVYIKIYSIRVYNNTRAARPLIRPFKSPGLVPNPPPLPQPTPQDLSCT